MITEAGHFALILALFVALFQGTVPLIGASKGDLAWMGLARPAALAQAALVSLAFFALMHAYVTSDFSVLNVASNSHTDKPLLYKISGVWGNHEGSLLLWVLILALFGAAVALAGRNLPPGLRARTLSVQAMITTAFLLFILLTSNPFDRLDPAPANGNGLNPLLQDPGLALHPPFLYLGYVGFSMAFSFAIAALIEGRVDAAWARWVRPWTLLAWCFLTVGIALGSWWAYYELGWGGWWYWDPVENASFMPWLAGTALLHSAIVVEKRDTLKAWTVLLAIIAFSLSLIGTFLVRSGVLTSVHSFASDPQRGLFILLMLIVAIGGSLTLFAVRAPTLKSGGLFQPISREGALLLNNVLMTSACATVLLGTLYPLFVDALGGGRVSVGPPFFNSVFLPLMIPLVAAMAVGPLLSWKRGDLPGALGRLKVAFVAVLLAAVLTWFLKGGDEGPLWAALGMGLAAWLFVGALVDLAERVLLFRLSLGESLRRMGQIPRAAWGAVIAHAGLAVVIAGVVGSSAWKIESVQSMKVGDAVMVAGYEFKLTDVQDVRGANYAAERGTFEIRHGDRLVTVQYPEKRQYFSPPRPTSETGVYSMLFGDLYAVIGEADNQGGHVTRLYYNPLVSWLWFGSALLTLGGLISLTDRRFRVGAPARRAASAPAQPAE